MKQDIGVKSPEVQFRILITLGILTSMSNIIDRSVLNILADSIKIDLGFSDTQLGLLSGFAFAFFYSVMGFPIARYVDRSGTDRPIIISCSVALWSAMTMASGLVSSYSQLLAARILLAIGESGSGPALVTLINHYAPSSKRSRIFSIYGLGVPFGMLLGLMVGGWLTDLVGWRMAFILVGAPGLLLALAIRILLYDPRRSALPDPLSTESHSSPMDNVLVIITRPALFWLTAATSVGGFFVAGLPSWMGIYLIRVLDLSPTRAGIVLGLIMGVGGAIGTYIGGELADRVSTRDPGRALLVPCFGLIIGTPAAIAALLTNDWAIFAVFYSVSVMGAAAYVGPMYSLLQLVVEERQRATTIVIVVMLINLVGAGCGPLLIGFASDLMAARMGEESLRWAMIAGYLTAIFPAFFYFKASRLVRDELK